MLGSGWKTTSRVLFAAAWPAAVPDPPPPAGACANPARTDTGLLGNAVFGIDPSCSHLRQALSNGDISLAGAGAIGAGLPGFERSPVTAGGAGGGGAWIDNPLCLAQYSRTSS